MATKAEKVASSITQRINGDHHIHDASHLVVDAKTRGFLFWKKTEIFLAGRVDTDREKEAIDSIINSDSKDFIVHNNLRVQRR